MSPDIGEASEDVAVTYAAAALAIHFNPTLLLDALAILDVGAEIELGFNDESSPVTIRRTRTDEGQRQR